MQNTSANALILWLSSALSILALVSGFNVFVDPFGYFDRNTLGYYFSSERQFKKSLVRTYDYNAIILGDSRVAYIDTAAITSPDYVFVNGGFARATPPEQMELLLASRLDRLDLVILGLQFGDLAKCAGYTPPGPWALKVSWDPLRFAASWTQFIYGIEALTARAQGLSPEYRADGVRTVISKEFAESPLEAKTARYWEKIKEDIPRNPSHSFKYELGVKCRDLLADARGLADRYGFDLVIVFLPKNRDLLQHLDWDTPEARRHIKKFLVQVEDIVGHVVDLSNSSFSDSRNFWLDDAMHFKPLTGTEIVEEAIKRSIGAQASK